MLDSNSNLLQQTKQGTATKHGHINNNHNNNKHNNNKHNHKIMDYILGGQNGARATI